MTKKKGRTLRLAKLKLTKVTSEETKESTRIEIPDANGKGKLEYFVVPAFSSTVEYTPAIGRGMRSAVRSNTDVPANERPGFNLFPLALDSARVPWAEATLYLLHRLLDDLTSDMSTLYGIAGDLAAYRAFLDEQSIDWLHFPSQRPTRPTYRYNAELKLLVRTNELEHNTAKRRMGSCNDPAKPAHLKQLRQTPQPVSSCPAPDAAGGGYRSRSSHQ